MMHSRSIKKLSWDKWIAMDEKKAESPEVAYSWLIDGSGLDLLHLYKWEQIEKKKRKKESISQSTITSPSAKFFHEGKSGIHLEKALSEAH